MIKQVMSNEGWVWMVLNPKGYQYGRTFWSRYEAEVWAEGEE